MKELTETTKELNKTLKELTKILKVLEKHEYLELHRSKWKLIGHNILLGMLFAVGTVVWLVLLSWFTFNFLKDSSILNQIVQNQLKIRQIDVGTLQEKVINDIKTQIQSGEGTGSGK